MVALSVVGIVYQLNFPAVWSDVKAELVVEVLRVMNGVGWCFVLYLFVNCGFGNDDSLQMMVGSHGQD
jgi:hypothetical protein